MTPSEANQIDIDKETNLEKLRELVKYWQNLAYQNELKISKLNVLPAKESLNLLLMPKLDDPETINLMFL